MLLVSHFAVSLFAQSRGLYVKPEIFDSSAHAFIAKGQSNYKPSGWRDSSSGRH